MSKKPEVNATYQHYKGHHYKVIAVGRDSETLEDVVVYQNLDVKKDVWVRPLKMFMETVEVNGKKVPRFKKEN